MENLPDDVLSDIFIRLRAKQIAQMRCISKYWNAHFSQSSFINSHLDCSIHNKDRILLVFSTADPFNLEQFTIRPYIKLPNVIKLPVDTQFRDFTGEVIGSVNGLICFKYGPTPDSETIYIWNPSLSALLTVPPYSLPHLVDKYIQFHYFRFGYDPKTDDYKVFKHTEGFKYPIREYGYGYNLRVCETFPLKNWVQFEVYSMRKGSWKVINRKIPSHLKLAYRPHHLCLDEYHPHLHWLGKNETGQVIVAFDLSTETFREIHLPVSIRHDEEILKYFGVLGGKLCVMSKVPDGECEVWVMGEYGVVESWVKRHVFRQFNYIDNLHFKSHGFTVHNEFIFQIDNRGVWLHDLIADTTKFFRFRDGWKGGVRVVEYVDSLVWVAPAK
ncbi:hypothetical protein LXL04_004275 [Taraxacum kok-saghyz]